MSNSSKIELAFRRYSAGEDHLNKLQFQCSFVFLTGMKPSKQDLQVVRSYMESEGGVPRKDF